MYLKLKFYLKDLQNVAFFSSWSQQMENLIFKIMRAELDVGRTQVVNSWDSWPLPKQAGVLVVTLVLE